MYFFGMDNGNEIISSDMPDIADSGKFKYLGN